MSMAVISISASIEHDIAQIIKDWNADRSRDKAEKAATVMIASHQTFRNWRQTWIESSKKPNVTLETLWGESGLDSVLKLLQSVMNIVEDIKQACQSLASRRVISGWKRVFPNRSRPSKQIIVSRPSNLSLLVNIMGNAVDHLCFYSRFAFDSLHRLVVSRNRTSSGDIRLWNSIRGRLGSLKLYRRYREMHRDYSLGIDLFNPYPSLRQRSMVRYRRGQPDRATDPCYHLFIQKQDYRTEIREISFENPVTFGTHETGSVAESGVNSLELEALQSDPKHQIPIFHLLSKETNLQPPRLVEEPPTIISTPKSESLATVLDDSNKIGQTTPMHPLTQGLRLALAFKLAESVFHLLGTPWLASLSCRRLRRIYDEERQNPFVLEIQTLDLEDLAYDDPEALAEPFQLFNLGVILIELALEKQIRKVTKDLYMETSKTMEVIEQRMGQQYREAIAFCVRDRKNDQRFSEPNKYDRPEETGWQAYLQELLVEFDSQVLSRLKTLVVDLKSNYALLE